MERSVIGIDAAWTEKNPSGVALVTQLNKNWTLLACKNCYGNFISTSLSDEKPSGSKPQVFELLAAAKRITKNDVSIIAVDIPLSRKPIEGRRLADDEISREYGARGAATHSPKKEYGKLSDDLCGDFKKAGFELLTRYNSKKGLIEVYPHPALIELTGEKYRLPYKAGKIRNYWRDDPAEIRIQKLFLVWRNILNQLREKIVGIDTFLSLPMSSSGRLSDIEKWRLKAFEDQLDAVICAWVGICFLEGNVKPFGDPENSAIWVPWFGD